MTIGQMHDMFEELVNQGPGGYFPPEVIDSFLNSASLDKFNEERREFERTSHISDNLAPFKKRSSAIALTSGIGSLPTDYAYRTNASTLAGKKVEIVPDGEWVDRINDPIATPSETNPIAAIRSNIEVNPTSVTSIYLFYLRYPATMEFDYDDDDGDIDPSPGTSISCDWPVSCHEDIVIRALTYAGVPLTEEVALRFKSLKKQTEGV